MGVGTELDRVKHGGGTAQVRRSYDGAMELEWLMSDVDPAEIWRKYGPRPVSG